MSRFYTIVAATDVDEHVEHAADTTEHPVEAAGASAHTTEPTHAEESQGIAALGLDPAAIGAQLLTFLVLFWVVKKFALSGIVKNLQKRHEDLNRGLHLTAELDRQKAELETQVEKVLRTARKDADMVIAEAKIESGSIIKAAEEAAGRRAEEVIKAAESKIERDIAQARNGLKAEMAELIVEATEAVLNQKLDAGADRKLVEKYLSEVVR